jgi:hypothetical protein
MKKLTIVLLLLGGLYYGYQEQQLVHVSGTMSFFGQYESNERGGVVHWTHDDPRGRHVDGWLEHDGNRYH